jgi:hypothetical protein
MWLTILLVCVATVASILSLVTFLIVARYAARLKLPPIRRLVCLEEQHEAMFAQLERMAARDRMRKVRAAGLEPERNDTAADPYTNPDAWKKQMRLKSGLAIATKDKDHG